MKLPLLAVFPIKVISTSIFDLLQELHPESIGGDESKKVKARSPFDRSASIVARASRLCDSIGSSREAALSRSKSPCK